jgi:ribosomal protein S18 acetylase RimI-like enzyme
MWVKFDLLQRVHDDSLSFIPVQRSEVRKVAAIVNRNFGYVYAYAIGKPNHRKDSLKLVYALLSSGSIFSWFGSSHYYWIYDKLQNRNVGLACLKTQHNYCFAYTTFSAIAFVIRYLSITSIRAGLTNIHALIQNAHYLKRLDLSSQFGVEVTYLVIHPNKRRLGYARKVMEALLQAKIYSKSLYPLKNTPLEHVDILVRETNEPALTFFSNLGFQLRAKIQDARFDSETNAGGAFVMRHSMFSARNGV